MGDYRIISKHFMLSNKAHLPLNDTQIRLRDAIQSKINRKIYNLKDCRCLCGSHDETVIAETDRYGFSLRTVICRTCGILRINPRLDERSLREFYSQEYQELYFDAKKTGLSDHFQAQRVNGLHIKDFIKARLKDFKFNGRSILEIGCSAGGVLMPFLEDGATVKGYDYNNRYLEYGRSINNSLDLRYGGIDEIKDFHDQFDLIIINHVLEHLADPKDTIQAAKGLLKNNGILYISVPGIRNTQYYNSPTRSYLGSLHIAHLYHFSRSSLVSIMDDFEPIFIDDKVNGIFRKSPGRKAAPFPSEYESNLRFILWHENSFAGLLARKFDCIMYKYYIYTRVPKILYSLRTEKAR